MIEALTEGAKTGAWAVGFFTVLFVGLTILGSIVKVGRRISQEDQKPSGEREPSA